MTTTETTFPSPSIWLAALDKLNSGTDTGTRVFLEDFGSAAELSEYIDEEILGGRDVDWIIPHAEYVPDELYGDWGGGDLEGLIEWAQMVEEHGYDVLAAFMAGLGCDFDLGDFHRVTWYDVRPYHTERRTHVGTYEQIGELFYGDDYRQLETDYPAFASQLSMEDMGRYFMRAQGEYVLTGGFLFDTSSI